MRELVPFVIIIDRFTDTPDGGRAFDVEDETLDHRFVVAECVRDRHEFGCSGHVVIESMDMGLFHVWRQWGKVEEQTGRA
jgi:hypothetical protein